MSRGLDSVTRDDRRFRAIVTTALLVVLLAGVSINTSADPDMWHQMAWARALATDGAVPRTDSFAFTPTVDPVIHHEWGTGVILHALAGTLGPVGVVLLRYALLAAIVVGAVCVARRRDAGFALGATLALPAIMLAWGGFSPVRAQMLTLAFLVAELLLLEQDRAGRRAWIGPWLILYVVWLNVHAGFVAGFVIFMCHAVEQAIRRQPVAHLVAVGGAMAALVTVNPWGTSYYGFLWRATRLDRSLISEWDPTWAAWPPVFAIYLLTVGLLLYALFAVGPRRARGVLVVLAAAYAGLRHQRHLPIHAVVWFALVPAWLHGSPLGVWLVGVWERRRVAIAVLAALVGLPCAVLAMEGRPWRLTVPANPGEHPWLCYPVGAVAYLADAGFEGNALVPFEVGAYVSWRLHPAVRVSIDGRYEVAYADGVLEQHAALFNGRVPAETVLDGYGADVALVPRGKPLAGRLSRLEGWRRVYRDDAYEIHARRDLALPVIDRSGERLEGRFP